MSSIQLINSIIDKMLEEKEPERYFRRVIKVYVRRLTEGYKVHIKNMMKDIIESSKRHIDNLNDIINDKIHYTVDEQLNAMKELDKQKLLFRNAHIITFEVENWTIADKTRDDIRERSVGYQIERSLKL